MSALRVAYEDDYLLVVDKQPDLVVHPAPGHHGQTLVDLLLVERGPWPGDSKQSWQAGVVHRLDRDTSGLMLVAKHRAAKLSLQEMIRRRQVEREYLALVYGKLDARRGTIDAPIGRDLRDRTRMSVTTDKPREARTHFEVEEWFHDSTLVQVKLETGRTHQIRAHFSAIGHPVVGDLRYGGAARSDLARQFLHARRLRFDHPFDGRRLELESPLPADLSTVLTALA